MNGRMDWRTDGLMYRDRKVRYLQVLHEARQESNGPKRMYVPPHLTLVHNTNYYLTY
jgi:hypothetical protein